LAHNTFLSVLTEVGLLGFILFMCVLAVTIHQSIKQEKNYAFLWIAILTIWSIGVFTLTWEYRKATWLILTLIIVGANIKNKSLGNEDRPLISSINEAVMYP